MKNEVLNEIVEFATKKLKERYGYCGVASGDDVVMINSDDRNGNDIKIKIEVKSEE